MLTLTSAALLLPSGVRPHLGKLIGCIVRGPILGLLDTSKDINRVFQFQHEHKTTEDNQFSDRLVPVGQLA